MTSNVLAPIEQLPNEVLDKIVSFAVAPTNARWWKWYADWPKYQNSVRNICLVSHTFYHSARHLLYRNIQLRFGVVEPPPPGEFRSTKAEAHQKVLLDDPSLGKYCKFLQLCVSKMPYVEKDAAILRACTTVKDLYFELCIGDSPAPLLHLVGDNLKSLERVRIGNIDVTAGYLADIISALQKLPHLQEVRLSDLYDTSDEIVSQVLDHKGTGRFQHLSIACAIDALDLTMAMVQWPRQLSKLEIHINEDIEPEGWDRRTLDKEANEFRELLMYHRDTLKSLTISSRMKLDWYEFLKLSSLTQLEYLRLDIGSGISHFAPNVACTNLFSGPNLKTLAWSVLQDNLADIEHGPLWLIDVLVLIRERGLALKNFEIDVDFCYNKCVWRDRIETASKVAAYMGLDVKLIPTPDDTPYFYHLGQEHLDMPVEGLDDLESEDDDGLDDLESEEDDEASDDEDIDVDME